MDCKWSKTPKGTKTYSTIVSQAYWQTLEMCVDILKPLVKVLRLVDGDWRPAMGFVYGELKDAKKEIIRICKNEKEAYEPILDIIDSKAKDRLDSPLHLTGYLLNPYFFYRDNEVQMDPKCMGALLTCVESFFPDDYETQNLVCNIELTKYKTMQGIFGRKLAILGRANNDNAFNPGIYIKYLLYNIIFHFSILLDNLVCHQLCTILIHFYFKLVVWWSNYGSETPYFQMMAMKILSLTTSSSGCERNWSTFQG